MKRLAVGVFIFAFLHSCAHAQGAMSPLQTATSTVNGITRPLPGATVTVCAANASGIPCAPVLTNTIFKNVALTQSLSNPFPADANGNYQFAAAAATYTVTVTAIGFKGYSYQVTLGGSGGASNLGQLNGGTAPSGQTYNFGTSTVTMTNLTANTIKSSASQNLTLQPPAPGFAINLNDANGINIMQISDAAHNSFLGALFPTGVSSLDDIGAYANSPATNSVNVGSPALGNVGNFWTGTQSNQEIFNSQLIFGTGSNPKVNESFGFSGPVAGSAGQHSISFSRGAGLTGQGTPWTWILPTDTFGITFNHALTANRAVSWPDFAGSVAIASGPFNLNDCLAVAAIDAGGLPQIGDGGPCGSGGGSPGGTNTAVQFNNAAAFGGDAVNFNFNPTTHALTITGAMTTAANSFVLTQLVNPSTAGDSICGNSTPVWADCVPGVNGRSVTTGTDTLASTDRQQQVTYNFGTAVAASIASAASFGNNYVAYLRNENAGTVTITPTTSTINGASSATLLEGYHATLSSPDNTNYFLDYSPGLLSAGPNITLTQTQFGTQISASGVGAFAGGSGSSFQDVTEIAAPANPGAGVDRLWLDSTSHTFSCKTSSGSNCAPTGGSGSFGGTNTQTTSYTLASGDAGKLVVMNCASVCTVTAPATQPSTSFSAYVMSTNSNATFVLGGTDTYNGASVVPLLLPFTPVKVSADSATATNYLGAYQGISFDGAHTATLTPVSGTTAIFTAPSGTTAELLSNGTNVNAAVISQSGDVSLTTNSNTKHIKANDGFTHASTTVTFSATPAFNAGPDDTFEITLTGNVTSSTITNLAAGEHLTFTVCQDATGGRTFVWPTSPTFRGVGTIGSTASTCSTQRFWYDGTNMFATSAMVTGE